MSVFCISCVGGEGPQGRPQAGRCELRLRGLPPSSGGGARTDIILVCQRRLCIRKRDTPDRRSAWAQARDPLPQLKKYALEKGILTEQQARARAAGR